MILLKSVIVLFLATISLNPRSCDDNTFNPDSQHLIVGQWELTSFTQETTLSLKALGQTRSEVIIGEGSNFDYTLTFNEDNTLITNGTYDFTVSVSSDGQTIPENTFTITDVNEEGLWSTEGDQLTFSGSLFLRNDSYVPSKNIPTISTLNTTTLIITMDLSGDISDDIELPNDAEFDSQGTVTITFTRIS